MQKNVKIGLEGLLRPEGSIVVLIDQQPYQFANLNSHDPGTIINGVTLAWELQLPAMPPAAH